jgi:hypothetical protein
MHLYETSQRDVFIPLMAWEAASIDRPWAVRSDEDEKGGLIMMDFSNDGQYSR